MNIKTVREFQVKTRLVYWIREREAIRKKKEKGRPRPWTDDEILNTYRFCNVQREHDKVTRWIAKNWRDPHTGEEDLWFAMAVARLFNLPSTLEAIGYPVPWTPNRIGKILKDIRDRKEKVFNGAYIVSTNGLAMGKIEYVVEKVLRDLWSNRKTNRPSNFATLAEYHQQLQTQSGLGSFMAAQIIADVKYATNNEFEDWHTFAASGPGSRRGLNRVLDNPVKQSWKESKWREELTSLQIYVHRMTKLNLHAQDVQNCLCEFDKYERALFGQGRPKQRY